MFHENQGKTTKSGTKLNFRTNLIRSYDHTYGGAGNSGRNENRLKLS